jgi:hypothetical protein
VLGKRQELEVIGVGEVGTDEQECGELEFAVGDRHGRSHDQEILVGDVINPETAIGFAAARPSL